MIIDLNVIMMDNLEAKLEKSTCALVLVLTIFNEGAYLTFKSMFHKALNLF